MTDSLIRPIDPNRLRRAATRKVERVGANQFLVEGRTEPSHRVDLDDATPCGCPDARVRGTGCLHELAARLHTGDGELVLALGAALETAERELRTMRTRTRKQRTA